MIDMFRTSFGPIDPAVTTFAIAISAVCLAWFSANRTSLEPSARRQLGILASLAVMGWYVIALGMGKMGIFFAAPDLALPRIPFPIVLPVAAAILIMMRSTRVQAMIDAVPFSWLTIIQVYRALGVMFIGLWAVDRLPGEFALPAGWGDIIVGLTAIPVALMAASGHHSSPAVLRAWNLFGVADLIVAVAMGFLTSPGPYQLLALDHPNLLISAYPLVLVPIFAVPLSFILHAAGFIKLRRMAAASCHPTQQTHWAVTT